MNPIYKPTPELWERCRHGEALTNEELLCLHRDTVATLASIEARGPRFAIVAVALRDEGNVLLGSLQARGLAK